jgi:putative transposase
MDKAGHRRRGLYPINFGQLGTGAVGIDIGCKSALAVTDGEIHELVEAPKFLRNAERQIKKASKSKRRRRSPNRKSKTKASRGKKSLNP